MPAGRNRQDAYVTSNRGAVQAKPVGLLDSHIHKLSDKFVAALKYYDFVGARPAH